jgi:hypothetical protein
MELATEHRAPAPAAAPARRKAWASEGRASAFAGGSGPTPELIRSSASGPLVRWEQRPPPGRGLSQTEKGQSRCEKRPLSSGPQYGPTTRSPLVRRSPLPSQSVALPLLLRHPRRLLRVRAAFGSRGAPDTVFSRATEPYTATPSGSLCTVGPRRAQRRRAGKMAPGPQRSFVCSTFRSPAPVYLRTLVPRAAKARGNSESIRSARAASAACVALTSLSAARLTAVSPHRPSGSDTASRSPQHEHERPQPGARRGSIRTQKRHAR